MELPFLFVKGQHLRSGTPIIDNYAIVFNMFPIYRILGSTTSKNQKNHNSTSIELYLC